MQDLERFIVEAKAACCVGDGVSAASSRKGSRDLRHESGGWACLDSYFGGTDFLGQETVRRDEEPVWAMNYYGRILAPDFIDGARAGYVIKRALSALCLQNRFLGGFSCCVDAYRYEDRNQGDVTGFTGIERIFAGEGEVYRLDYHRGLIRP